MKETLINTGDDRNVTAHFISGAIGAALINASINAKRDPQAQTSPLRESYKVALLGGVATAGAVSATNKIGKGDYVGALLSVALSSAAVYAVDKAYQGDKHK